MKKVFNFIFIFLLTIILFASNKVYAEEWIGECHYKYAGEGTENIYDIDMYFNRYNLSIDSGNGIKAGFSLNELLEYYDKNNKCPDNLYILTGTSSLKAKWNLNDNENYSGIYTRKAQKFYPENDNWLTDDDEIYSQCYYQISTGSGGAEFTTIDQIALDFNNDKYSVYVVDSNLNKKNGSTLTMNDGVSTITYSNVDIDIADLHNYYKNNSSGCPNKIYWDKNGVLYLSTKADSYSQKYEGTLTSKSTSKNKELNLDGSKITSSDTSLPNITTCTGLLGEPDDEGSPAYYLVKAFDVIKYVAIVLLIVLSVMDFTGAVTKQDKDALSKILKRVMMRFVLCIIIFFLPYFVKLLLHYLVERQIDLCGIGG